MITFIQENIVIITIAALCFSWWLAFAVTYLDLNLDFVFYRGQKNLYQINFFNWRAPNWEGNFKAHYRHYGPVLVVSRALRQHSCARGCCTWVALEANPVK